jgi:N6-L-threonylcarbamoyladenine synthase
MTAKRKITILALETSADETSAAVVKGDMRTKTFSLASNVVYSQIAAHQKTGGIVPEVAARAHIPKILPAVKLALAEARVELNNLGAIAVTAGPGLVTSLRIGVDTAKALGFALHLPVVPINHLEGHLLSALPSGQSPSLLKLFPALGLIVSGGHTILVLVKNIGQYKILGQTVDDAAGEAFDKIAKILGLPYPGGPPIAKLGQTGNPHAFTLPRPMLKQHNYNFSFAGLKTHVLYLWQQLEKTQTQKTNLAASAESAIVEVLVEKTARAALEYKVKGVLLGGGVAANQKLRSSLEKNLEKRTHAKFLRPNLLLTTDNAGMIGVAAFFHLAYGQAKTTYKSVRTDPQLVLKSWR